MAHTHNHSHSHAHGEALVQNAGKAFIIGIALNVVFIIAEVIAGLLYDSVALLTDAGHNVSDVASLTLSLVALKLVNKKSSKQYTYGFKKTTVLAAFINAVILLVAIGVLGFEAIIRLTDPKPVEGNIIAWVAGLGIAINAISAFLFFKDRNKELNSKSAYLHLMADALVSVGVVIGGIVIQYTGWYWIDPVIGLVIMIVILLSTWSLLADSFKMSIDAVPANIDFDDIKHHMQQMRNVVQVHHLHIWPLSTSENALTAHIVLNPNLSFIQKMDDIKNMKAELKKLNITHCTIELDANAEKCKDD